LGFGDPHIVTSLHSGFITYYFRHTFSVTDAASVTALTLRVLRDDGAVVYLNGVEVYRSNMPGGPIGFTTLALTAVAGFDETNYFPAAIANLLVDGANTIAAEVHQVNLVSSDVGFDLSLSTDEGPSNSPPVANSQSVTVAQGGSVAITLTGSDPDGTVPLLTIVAPPAHGSLSGTPPSVTYTPAPAYVGPDSFTFQASDGFLTSAPATVSITVISIPVSLVATGSVWKYLDTGVDLGTAWVSGGFDDSSWLSGPGELGFGDGDEATVLNRLAGGNPIITYYFRHTFQVPDVSAVPGLALELYRDDGAIIYLNGVEVFRNNMPAGPVNFLTFAFLANDDGNLAVMGRINRSALVNGANVLAVEVHQSAITSSDVSFDLGLRAAANQAPTANDSAVTAPQNTATPIMLSGSDPDGDPLLFTVVTGPAHGGLNGVAPNLSYTPTPGFQGQDSFTFSVSDGVFDSAPATVTIDVVVPPDPPDVIAVVADCNGTSVQVVFDEPLDVASATDLFNYLLADSFGNQYVVVMASLGPEQRTVQLEVTPPLTPGPTYTLLLGSVCDLQGDCMAPQSFLVSFETEPPSLDCGVAVASLLPANNGLVDVGFSAVSDGFLQLQVFSDEPEVGALQDATFASGVLQLRARKSPGSNGRVYLVVVTAMDPCGNTSTCCRTVVVPKNSTAGAFSTVNAEAQAAQANCSAAGSPTTPYRKLP
jgi:hypothetical protein